MGDNVGQQAWGLLMMFCCDGRGWVVIDDAGHSPTVGFFGSQLKKPSVFRDYGYSYAKVYFVRKGGRKMSISAS